MRYLKTILTITLIFVLGGCSNQPESANLTRAAYLLNNGKPSAAMKAISSEINSNPSEYNIYISSISLLSDHRRYKDAALIADSLSERLKTGKLARELTREELASTYISLGMLYQEVPDLPKAERAYKSALALAPDSPILLNNLGWFYADEGINLDEALKLTERAARFAPDDGNIVDSLGWALYKHGLYKAAVNELRRAVELNPDTSELRYHLGAAYAKAELVTEARIELKKALILDTNMTEASTLLKTLQK